MNEFERLLKSQLFREVPPEWRREMLPKADAAPDPGRGSGWRDWFWPSPLAWGAMAAVWVVFVGGELAGGSRSGEAALAPAFAGLSLREEPGTPRAFLLTPQQERLVANLR